MECPTNSSRLYFARSAAPARRHQGDQPHESTTIQHGTLALDLTRETMRPLLDLQQVDVAIDRLGALQKELPEQQELDRLTAERDAARTVSAQAELAFGAVSREFTKVEAEVTAIAEKIDQESKRLYGGTVSSPKELTNIQAELDALRKRKTQLEDRLLEHMESRESAEALLNQSKEAASTLEAAVTTATAARDDSSTHIELDLAEALEQREKIVPTIPEEALEIYTDIRPKREGGVAVSILEGGVCRGCMVSLSPVALDSIRRSDEPLVRCENCRRLLIIN